MVVEAHIRQKFLCDFVKMFSIDELLKNETTDEEQNAKYLEVVELLLAAGYFRARIKGLTPFDKVVGGMTWCISTCDVDIDVDLLFQENSTIGQKIALTEKIVAVLPRMKCPHRIEPHQIQGLDFINIYPVVQWLVKQAIETRTEQGDRLRAYSISQFNKTHTLPQDKEKESKLDACIDAVKTFKETYKPRRVYKKPAAYANADEGVQVQSTLLEYGQKYMFTSKTGKDDNELNAEQKAVAEGLTKIAEAAEEANQEEEKKIKTLMEGMSETERQQMLSSRLVGSIVGLKSDEISNIAQHYAKRQEALEQQASELKYGKGGAVAIHQRQVAALTNAIQTQKEKLEESQTELGKISQEVNESSAKVNKLLLLKKRIEQEIENLNKQESEDTEKKLNKLRALVTQNEDLKKEEQEFKEKCLAEKKELDDKIQVLNEEIAANNNIDAERIQAIEEQIENDNKRLHKIRLLLGKKNRDNASLQWKIDAVPSRAELAQYQRRFVELYNQVASTHKETKQFYSFYNTLDDKKLQLDKEVGILNSIHDGFAQACSQSMESKNEFLDQLEKITLGVKQNEERAEKKRQSEKEKRDTLNQKSIELNEKQRLYHKTVRDFQEECKKSELIQAKIRSMEAAK